MKFAILRSNPGYRRLWIADLLSQTGSQVSNVALFIMVFQFRSSTSDVAGLVFCQTIPAVVFGLYAGAIIDRFPKKRLLVGADLIRMVTVATIPFLTELWAIYLLAFLTSTASTLFQPTRLAVIPELVEERDRVHANALSSITFGTMLFAGPALGGAIVGFWSTKMAFILDSATFLFSALWLARIPLVHRAPDAVSSFKTLTQDIRSGMRYVWSHSTIAFLFAVLFVGNTALGFWFPVLPSFNKNFLHGNNFTFGLLTSAFGLGSLLAGPIAPSIANRFAKGKILYTTLFLDAACFVIFSRIPSLYASLAMQVFWGANVVILIVVYDTMLQNIIEPEFRGRVFSMSSMQFNGGILIAQLIAVNVATVLRPEQIFLYSGLVYISVLLLAMLHRSFRILIRVR